ncbi:MAG: hypothetical protein ACLU0O_01755 [Collinsella sp.]
MEHRASRHVRRTATSLSASGVAPGMSPAAAQAAYDKGEDVQVLDLTNSDVCDYFVLYRRNNRG